MLPDLPEKRLAAGEVQRGLLAAAAGVMCLGCLGVALWASTQFPPAGWLCYAMALGWSFLGAFCLSRDA